MMGLVVVAILTLLLKEQVLNGILSDFFF